MKVAAHKHKQSIQTEVSGEQSHELLITLPSHAAEKVANLCDVQQKQIKPRGRNTGTRKKHETNKTWCWKHTIKTTSFSLSLSFSLVFCLRTSMTYTHQIFTVCTLRAHHRLSFNFFADPRCGSCALTWEASAVGLRFAGRALHQVRRIYLAGLGSRRDRTPGPARTRAFRWCRARA